MNVTMDTLSEGNGSFRSNSETVSKEIYQDDDNKIDDERLLHTLPEQTNQSFSVCDIQKSIRKGRRYGENLLGVNYMYKMTVMDQTMTCNNDTYTDLMTEKRTEEILRLGDKTSKTISNQEIESHKENIFQYDLNTINKELIEVDTNCTWLDCRLSINYIINDKNIPFDQLFLQLKVTLINVVNDLMIFYHTSSTFLIKLIKKESFSLLTLLKDQRLDNITKNLSDGFSVYLIDIIKNADILLNISMLKITIPSLAEIIMNNYAQMKQKNSTLKAKFHDIPKVVFYSFSLPIYIVMNGNHINTILDKKIKSLQRRYFCKVILDGSFKKKILSNETKEYIRIDILLDYQFNYWGIVQAELIKWMNTFVRSIFQCYIEKICLSFLTPNFFCCDEVQNLMKRQHLLREVDINFAKVIKWLKINQLDRSVL